jgi:hypothetical protein
VRLQAVRQAVDGSGEAPGVAVVVRLSGADLQFAIEQLLGNGKDFLESVHTQPRFSSGGATCDKADITVSRKDW